MQLGFIGIGVMGRPMVLNLLKAGHQVTIFARHPEKPGVQEVLQAGAMQVPSARAVAIASDIVITMVPNSQQVEEVVTGEQGILEGARKGLIIIDMSTIAPTMSKKNNVRSVIIRADSIACAPLNKAPLIPNPWAATFESSPWAIFSIAFVVFCICSSGRFRMSSFC